MKRVAALLTVHNRRETTLRCLECLFFNKIPEDYALEVYLTDDGCTDGTAEAVAEQYPSVRIIKGDGSLFWNRGMWTAWNEAAKSDYDYYLWLNDDTFLYVSAVEELLTIASAYNDHVIVVGPAEDTSHHEITYGGYVGTLADSVIPPLSGTAMEIDFFNGNIVLVPRTVFLKLGNLDYHFRHSKGDFDYGMRAKEMGILMLMTGRVLGECDEHPNIDAWRDPQLSLDDRWRALRKPTGMAPAEFFYFDRKHHGVITGLKHYLSIHLQCLFPRLWHYKS